MNSKILEITNDEVKIIKKCIRYDYKFLIEFCNENNIKLNKDYNNENVTHATKIKALCIKCDNDMIEKSFRALVKNKIFTCSECFYIIRTEKTKNTNLERYGCENVGQNKEIQEKIGITNIEKYGHKCTLQNEKIKEKSKETCIEKYGCEHIYSQHPFYKNQVEQTNIKKYGYSHWFQNEEIKEKIKTTNLERYGYDCGFKNPIIQEKIKTTNIERYGYEHVMKNKEIAEKALKNSFQSKEYIYPSGRIDLVQGYEPFGLDDLLNIENIDENDIITSRTEVPAIWWNDNMGNKHRYFIDIFIPSLQRGIEIKSLWTYKKEKDSVLLKQQAFIDAGYMCDIWVYDAKGIRITI